MRVRLLFVVPALLFAVLSLPGSPTFAQNAVPPAIPDPNPAQSQADPSQVHKVGSGVSMPIVIWHVDPKFSDQARAAKFEGTVLVALIVDSHGLPQNVHVLRGVGMGLDESAVEAIKQYRFKPAMEAGKPVPVQMNVEVNFRIREKADATSPLPPAANPGLAKTMAEAAATYPGGQGPLIPAAEPSKFAIPGCAIDHAKPSDADNALAARKYADAERLYTAALTADANSSAAMAGLVHTSLAQGKLPQALDLATKYSSAHPTDAVLLDALGEVRFRRGEIGEAGRAISQAARIDGCNGQIHYDAASFLKLSGSYGSAQHELEIAHAQAPDNRDISRAWRSSHAVPLTAEQKIATLKKMLDNPALKDAQKEGINSAIKGVESNEKGNCELVSPVEEVKLPIIPVPDNGSIEIMNEAGLDVQLNGKKKRLEIDTGASGLTLSNAAAKSAGLVPEYQIKVEGIGDDGPARAYVTHIDDIKIGKMEFHNCMVQVLAPGNMVERMPDADGLIGPDVFRDYLVTLDYPGRELRLGSLPRRPGDQGLEKISLSTSEDEDSTLSYADRAKDRYVAPEMKDWTPVLRAQHMLIVPTLINNAPRKLFLLDTGAAMSNLSPATAKEVGQVSDFTDVQMQGVNGVARKVPAVGNISMLFAQIKQTRRNMLILDTGFLSRNVGAEVSGIIGFPILRELVLSIDYRDNLIHVVYDPKKGYHATNDNGAPVN